MAIRDIVVCLDEGAAAAARLRLALAVGRQANLTAIYVLPPPPDPDPLTGIGPQPPSVSGWALHPPHGTPHNPERAEDLERQFRSALAERGLGGEWYLMEAGDRAGLVDCAKSADLTILGQRPEGEGRDAAGGPAPDAVVLETGRPVLVVPYAGAFAGVGRRPLIAWDGSREAARALGDALPLIAGAEQATIVHIGLGDRRGERRRERARRGLDRPGLDRPGLDRIVAHLQRHGIAAAADAIAGGDVPIFDLLLSRAADLEADLIVAGAYHHSRAREALLGGVSRDLLRHMTVPVLMSH